MVYEFLLHFLSSDKHYELPYVRMMLYSTKELPLPEGWMQFICILLACSDGAFCVFLKESGGVFSTQNNTRDNRAGKKC